MGGALHHAPVDTPLCESVDDRSIGRSRSFDVELKKYTAPHRRLVMSLMKFYLALGVRTKILWRLIPVFDALSPRGLDPIKLAYSPSRLDGLLYSQPVPLTDWASMPAVLVTGPTVTQKSLFLL